MTSPPAKLPADDRAAASRRVRERGRTRPPRPWPVSANALLLLLGALGFGALTLIYLGPLGLAWPFGPELWTEHRDEVVLGFVFALLAVLSLASAVGFLRVAPGAWLLAVLVQGINLGLALLLYFGARTPIVYFMMLYGILMVLYLHQADVQAAFRPETSHAEAGTAA